MFFLASTLFNNVTDRLHLKNSIAPFSLLLNGTCAIDCDPATFSASGICTACNDVNAASCSSTQAISWCVSFSIHCLLTCSCSVDYHSNSPFNLKVDGTCAISCGDNFTALNRICIATTPVVATPSSTSVSSTSSSSSIPSVATTTATSYVTVYPSASPAVAPSIVVSTITSASSATQAAAVALVQYLTVPIPPSPFVGPNPLAPFLAPFVDRQPAAGTIVVTMDNTPDDTPDDTPHVTETIVKGPTTVTVTVSNNNKGALPTATQATGSPTISINLPASTLAGAADLQRSGTVMMMTLTETVTPSMAVTTAFMDPMYV